MSFEHASVDDGPTPAGEQGTQAGEGELVEAVPVLGEELTDGPAEGPTTLMRRYSAAPPAVQAAAAAAGGFVAGAAVLGLVQRRRRRTSELARSRRGRRLGRRGDSGGGVGDLIQIVGSRSLLVDVHLLGGPDGAR